MTTPSSALAPIPETARTIAAAFAALPMVTAVVMGGSRTVARADDTSDVDLYVYADGEVPVEERVAITAGAIAAEIDRSPWEPGDSWVDARSGCTIDVMYRSPGWIEAELDRTLVRHEASVGYSTCFWQNVRSSVPIYDRDGWFVRLQGKADQPYPEQLRRAVIDKNSPLLRESRFSFLRQAESAMVRGDGVAVQHRIAALLASYFDVLFALNRHLHPGEKRLVAIAAALPLVPPDLAERVDALIRSTAKPWLEGGPVPVADALIDALDLLLLSDEPAPRGSAAPSGS